MREKARRQEYNKLATSTTLVANTTNPSASLICDDESVQIVKKGEATCPARWSIRASVIPGNIEIDRDTALIKDSDQFQAFLDCAQLNVERCKYGNETLARKEVEHDQKH